MRLHVDRAAYMYMYFDKIISRHQLLWLYLVLAHMVQLQQYMYMYVYSATKQPSDYSAHDA